MADDKKNWMTQASYDKLQAELEQRSGAVRAEITKKIDAARREGDLKENGGYHAARDEQAHNETRILELQRILKYAEVGEATADGTIGPGCVVEAKIGSRTKKFLLASRDASQGMDVEVFDPQAPLGVALQGRSAGEKIEYTAPTGKKIQVEILSVKPYQG